MSSFLSVRRKSSKHFADSASSHTSDGSLSPVTSPLPPVPPLPSTPKQPSHFSPHVNAQRGSLSPAPSTSSIPSPSTSPAPLIVRRTKRVPPPSLGLEGAIDLQTPSSTYTSRFGGVANSPGHSAFPPSSPTTERPRYTLEVAFPPASSPLTRESSASPSVTKDSIASTTDDFEPPPSMSMLRTPTASSTHSRSSQLMPQGYGYGGEYNAAWSESAASGKNGHAARTPTTPSSAGLNPYKQPSGLAPGVEDKDEYDDFSRKMGGASRTSSFSSAHPRSASGATGISQKGRELDEEDRTAYTYALRVAALQEYLSSPPKAPSPSPPLTPPSPSTPGSTSGSELMRRKSSFGFLRRDSSSSALAGNGKGDEAVIKMPKEFLVEFWQILATASPPAIGPDGEVAWSIAKAGFLKGIKKGSRSESGGNLRDVGVLLETFTSYLPSDPQTVGTQHKHATHLLALLSSSLPRSSYFSPMAKQLSEKDRRLLGDIKNEIQTYSLPSNGKAGGTAGTPPVPSVNAHGTNGVPTSVKGEAAGMLGAMQKQTQSIKRKPSPSTLKVPSADGLVQVVGFIFGVRKEICEGDVEELKFAGALEEMYMHDLLIQLNQINSLSHPTTSQRQRAEWLQGSIINVQRSFPRASEGAEGFSCTDLFFTPPQKANTLSRLSTRASENITLGTRARELVSHCRDMWGIGSLLEKEREVETLMTSWCRSISTGCSPKEEMSLGVALCEGIDDLVTQSSGSDTGERPRVLSELGSACIKLLERATETLWTNTAARATPPPPSLLPLLAAANGAIWQEEGEQKALQDVADGIKAMAVGEYVRVLSDMGGMGDGAMSMGMGMGMGAGGVKSGAAPGYAAVGRWIDETVRAAAKAWGQGLGSTFDPAAIILSKQLPLFFAEMQMLDDEPSEQVMALYKVVVGLCEMWDDICPDAEHGFEPHAFFDPFVRGWIKQVAESQVQIWVSRAVGMDTWTLSTGESDDDKHSQSVDDLFESLSQATATVIEDIPAGGAERAGLLADMAKAIAYAMQQYASTVEALYDAEVCPDKLAQAYHFNNANGASADGAPAASASNGVNAAKIAGKASGWLSKGQQAVKGLEKKVSKVDGFVMPPHACVKLANMSAAGRALDGLGDKLLMATSTIRSPESPVAGSPSSGRRGLPGPAAFSVTVLGGENLHTKQGKSIEAFVVIQERETGERVLKTRTVSGDDARWHESLDRSVAKATIFDVNVYDRSLVGKHDLIASGPLNLDPKTAAGTRTLLLPLQPSGMLRLSVATDGGQKREVRAHLEAADALLARTEAKMAFACLERMMDFIRDQLGPRVLAELTRPNKNKPPKKLGMGIGGGKEQKVMPEQFEIEASLGELFGHLNANFGAFSTYLSPTTRHSLMLALWHRVLEHLISLLVPPLSDLPSRAPLLCAHESDIIFKWLQMIKVFFNAKEDDGTEYGIPTHELSSGRYKDLIMLGQYLDLPSPSLRERVITGVKAVGLANGSGGTMQGIDGLRRGVARIGLEGGSTAGGSGIGKEERGEGERMAEILLRIARTRSDLTDILAQQVGQYNTFRLQKQGTR